MSGMPSPNRLIVAIDGTLGSGKSTVARLVAQDLGLVHIDTGATYRLVAREALNRGVSLDDPAASAAVAGEVAAATTVDPAGRFRIDGREAGSDLRTSDVSRAASIVAAHPEVREVLVRMQRGLVPAGGAVVEGRDIGTVVWPDAQVKVFLDAKEDVRAARRSDDASTTASALEALRERDERDANRPVGAMRPAPDALYLDTSDLTPRQVAAIITARAGAQPARANALYRGIRATTTGLLRGFFGLEIRGGDNIPRLGPAIIAPNHRSLLDIFVTGALTKRKIWFMAKEELFSSPKAAAFFTRLGAFPVRRGRPDRTALQRSLELLRAGELVGLFPEGTRRPDGRFQHVEDGLAYVALKAGAPIVPVALSGTEAVFPPGSKLPQRVKVRALIGEPFVLGGPHEGVLKRAVVRDATAIAQQRLIDVMNQLEKP